MKLSNINKYSLRPIEIVTKWDVRRFKKKSDKGDVL